MKDDLDVIRYGEYGPSCFPTADCIGGTLWQKWRAAAHQAKPKGCKGHEWCCDCTPAFQAQQLRQGKCTHPEVRFCVDEDGWLQGFVPTRHEKLGVLEIETAL
jgi:hypothetical protein